jgi:glycine cleavage system H lipoate-binding protein/ABC-type phosphate transport system substrate-binding protein
MKTKILSLAVIFLLLVCGSIKSQEVEGADAAQQTETVTISVTPDLYALALQWTNEYGSLKPEVKFRVTEIANNKLDQGKEENLRFVSNRFQTSSVAETNWKMVIGRDVIVPVVNAGNPYLTTLSKSGISPEEFAQILTNPDMQNWGALLPDGQNAAIHIYLVNDESVKAGMAKFMKSAQFPIAGITIASKEEVISAIQNDPLAIGFCKVVNVVNQDNQSLLDNIKFLPIDKNGNGTIDYMEDIYADANTFLRGVWIGKYPKDLYSNIYAVSKVQPSTEAEIAFLSWILTDGQQYMNSNGYCSLVNTESQSSLNKINTSIVSVSPLNDTSKAGVVLLILAIVIALGIIISAGIRSYRKQSPALPDFNDTLTGFSENSVEVPKGIYFNKSHSWAFMEKDGNVSIGIDDFLQHVTGPLTRVEMRNPGEKVKKGELLFSLIQSGKRLNLYSPISGIIKQQNEALIADATKINSSPYIDGWIYRIEPSNWFVEVNFMDMADKYKKWINTEFSRMKDFLAATLKPDSLEYAHVVLQDGGIVKEGVLADFGPEVWDDFQTNFLEIYK